LNKSGAVSHRDLKQNPRSKTTRVAFACESGSLRASHARFAHAYIEHLVSQRRPWHHRGRRSYRESDATSSNDTRVLLFLSMHGCKRPMRLAPSPACWIRGVQWVSEITRRHAKYNWHERVQNNNERTARVVDLRREREVVWFFRRCRIVDDRNRVILRSWWKLVGMSETREIAREIVPHARNASLNIAWTRDYFGISCRRHRREFLQLRLLHPSIASDIERILKSNAGRERERERERGGGKRGWSQERP